MGLLNNATKQFQGMLMMIRDEAEMLHEHRQQFDIEEFKTRFYLLVDKLTFLGPFIETTPRSLQEEYHELFDRCETIFNEAVFSLERSTIYDEIQQVKENGPTADTVPVHNLLENLNDTKLNHRFMTDTAEEIEGVFLHTVLPENTMHLIETALQHYSNTLPFEQKIAYAEQLLLPEGKNQNERLNTFESRLLAKLLD